MGQQIAQQKGAMAFWIWAIVNSLTLAVFCYLHNSGRIKPEIYRAKPMKAIAVVIQLFCLVVQLNFIYQILNNLLDSTALTYAITTTVGSVFVLAMYTRGLKASIFTDILQWAIALFTIGIILAIGVGQGVPRIELAVSGASDITWGIWSAIILLAGPIGDVQHWQRMEADETKKGYYLGAGLFFLYMCLIFGMANLQFNNVMNIILLITVLCVTTSTIDSIAVALHEVGNKKIGTAICVGICVGWGLLAGIGMVDLWSSFGVIRVVFAVSILVLSLGIASRVKVGLPVIGATALVLTIFTYLGSIGIGNAFGVISLLTAIGLLMYLFLKAIQHTGWISSLEDIRLP